MRLASTLVGLLLLIPVWGQTIPEERVTRWSNAGLLTPLDTNLVEINVLNHGVVADGSTPADSAVNALIQLHAPCRLFFPGGAYYFEDGIRLKSGIALEGESQTVFTFNTHNETHLIQGSGGVDPVKTGLEYDAQIHDEFIVVAQTGAFQLGDLVRISDQDSSLITSSWALNSTGQLCRIERIEGDTLWFRSPLRRAYEISNAPYVQLVRPIENISIKRIEIQNLKETAAQTNSILLRYSQNCLITCVKSFSCNYAHVRLENSTNVEVVGSYFKDGHNYGGGGKAYGVAIMFASGECLVTQNYFAHLRHSMLLQAGANGNVFSYNYSVDPYWDDVLLPAKSAGDMVLHGNWVYMNLFEGNVCQNIVIDDSHGANGPFNTFFRNRAQLYGIFMNFGTPSHQQNFIGNEITNDGALLGMYYLSGNDHFEFGNVVRGVITPQNTANLTQASLYLKQAPSYFNYRSQWPPIGPPHAMDAFTIELVDRVASGLTVKCQDTVYQSLPAEPALIVYPNPTATMLYMKGLVLEDATYVLFNAAGQCVMSGALVQPYLYTGHLPPGVYVIRLQNKETALYTARFVKT